jgi:hypothetical protein
MPLMKSLKILTIGLGLSLLSVGLVGCGDDEATPIEKGVEEVHKADGAVDDLNELTKKAEEAAKASGE